MTTNLPLHHLSIRVPWHDSGWTGKICRGSVDNASCLRLANTHERRNDTVAVKLTSRLIDKLIPAEQPGNSRVSPIAHIVITDETNYPVCENATNRTEHTDEY